MGLAWKMNSLKLALPGPTGYATPEVIHASGDGVTLAYGTTVPSAAAGYAKGCIFIHTDGAAGTMVYVNEGTTTSSSFVAVVTPGNIDSLFDAAFPAGGAAAGRGPSTGIWSTCPAIDYMLDPTKGMVYFNDFQGDYVLAANQAVTHLDHGVSGDTGATAGSTISVLATDPNGALVISGTTDNETSAISALGGKNTAGHFVLTSGKKSWFEARIKTANITDAKYGFFCGFAEEALLAEDSLLADDGTVNDKDYIGFLRVEGDGDKLDTVHRKAAGAAVVVKADAITVAADTYIKVGFYCDGTTVTFYANGVALADTCALATATVPTGEEMAFYLILNNAAAEAATVTIDWVRIAREF
jgi:hypothetical protein